ncbi:hypothetical protein ACQPXM_25130 [Kribbella sp. CA-253562]|uniref:hypothetical protein n=1 Tax=Kribbella sp. CA-253562 TaxID=3239942 RepID=UPI003D8D5A27
MTTFSERGWISLTRVLGYEGWECALTPNGLGYIERIHLLRGDVVARKYGLRGARLRLLYGLHHGRPGLAGESFYGDPFSEREVTDADTWLHGKGLILGQPNANGNIFGPRISDRGADFLESGRSASSLVGRPADLVPAAVAVTVMGNNNPTNLIAESPGAVQVCRSPTNSASKCSTSPA